MRAPRRERARAASPPNVAKTLDGHGGGSDRHIHVGEVARDQVGDAGPGGLATTLGAAEAEGFAGDDGGHEMADVGGVGVHHPAHHLLVGAEVGCGDIHLRADERDELLNVATRKVFELGGGKAGRIDDDATLGPAVGQADEGGFPAHPHGQRGDLAERDIRVEADAALGWAGGEVVLNAVALENADGAVVAPDRDGDHDGAVGVFGAVADGLGQVDGVGGAIELLTRHQIDLGGVDGSAGEFGHGGEVERLVGEAGARWDARRLARCLRQAG